MAATIMPRALLKIDGRPVETLSVRVVREGEPQPDSFELRDPSVELFIELMRDFACDQGSEVEIREGDFVCGGTVRLLRLYEDRFPEPATWYLHLMDVWTGSRPVPFEQPALLDPRENRDYLVWWNAVAESSGRATALVFADWLEERGLTKAAEKIRTSDSPALDARRLVDLSRCRRDGQGRMVLGFATVRQLAEREPR